MCLDNFEVLDKVNSDIQENEDKYSNIEEVNKYLKVNDEVIFYTNLGSIDKN